MSDVLDLRRGTPTDADMEKINKVSPHPLSADEVYIFGLRLCDNEIDLDFERFTSQSLERLAEMYIGKTGALIDCQEVGRIFYTEVVREPERLTEAGDVYCWLKAYAYVVRTDATENLISEIKSGGQKEVSIGCSFNKCRCSICGKDIQTCEHIKGERYYLNELCFVDLEDPLDAYEWSFVVKPERQTDNTRVPTVARNEYRALADELRDNFFSTKANLGHNNLLLRAACAIEGLLKRLE